MLCRLPASSASRSARFVGGCRRNCRYPSSSDGVRVEAGLNGLRLLRLRGQVRARRRAPATTTQGAPHGRRASGNRGRDGDVGGCRRPPAMRSWPAGRRRAGPGAGGGALGLQGGAAALRQRVIAARARPAQRAAEATGGAGGAGGGGGVPAAAIGVVDESRCRSSRVARHREGVKRAFRAQLVDQRPADHAAGADVAEDGRVEPCAGRLLHPA